MPKKAQNKVSDDNRMNGYIKLFPSAFENIVVEAVFYYGYHCSTF